MYLQKTQLQIWEVIGAGLFDNLGHSFLYKVFNKWIWNKAAVIFFTAALNVMQITF